MVLHFKIEGDVFINKVLAPNPFQMFSYCFEMCLMIPTIICIF